MFDRAFELAAATRSKDLWYLTQLYQTDHFDQFIALCHNIISTFLDLSHDHFTLASSGWPLTSRIVSTRRDGNDLETSTSRQMIESGYRPVIGGLPLAEQSPTCKELRQASTTTPMSNEKRHQKQRLGDIGKALRSSRLRRIVHRTALPSLPSTPGQQQDVESNPLSPHGTPLKQDVSTNDLSATLVLSPPTQQHQLNKSSKTSSAKRSSKSTVLIDEGVDKENLVATSQVNYLIANLLLDYMLDNTEIHRTKGLFRISGNMNRVQDLYHRLVSHITSVSLRSNNASSQFNPLSLIRSQPAHDLISLLTRVISLLLTSSSCPTPGKQLLYGSSPIRSNSGSDPTACDGLIPKPAASLLHTVTRLQASLEPTNQLNWITVLCRARQLFTYRLVLCLLPSPERQLLIKFLYLLNRVALHSTDSQMTATSLARCTVNTIFGSCSFDNVVDANNQDGNQPQVVAASDRRRNPSRVRLLLTRKRQASSPSPSSGGKVRLGGHLKLAINTLVNLIDAANELDCLPCLLVKALRRSLRCQLSRGERTISRWMEVDNDDGESDMVSYINYVDDLLPPYKTYIMRQFDPETLTSPTPRSTDDQPTLVQPPLSSSNSSNEDFPRIESSPSSTLSSSCTTLRSSIGNADSVVVVVNSNSKRVKLPRAVSASCWTFDSSASTLIRPSQVTSTSSSSTNLSTAKLVVAFNKWPRKRRALGPTGTGIGDSTELLTSHRCDDDVSGGRLSVDNSSGEFKSLDSVVGTLHRQAKSVTKLRVNWS